VTSREDEYFDAVSNAEAIYDAAVVVLQPLQAADVAKYLKGSGGSRWTTVIDTLGREPEGCVARALSNPLMLWLATKVYADRNPDELTDRRLLDSQISIENHLLDELVPAVYGARRPAGNGFACTMVQAQKWLSFLAGKQGGRWSADYGFLAWWNLRVPVISTFLGAIMRAAVLLAAFALLVSWGLVIHGASRPGTRPGWSTLANLVLGGTAGKHYLRPAISQLATAIPAPVRHRADVAASLFHGASLSAEAYLVILLAAAYLVMLNTAFRLNRRVRPRRLKFRPVAMLGRVLVGSLLCALAFYITAWLVLRTATSPHHQSPLL